MKKTTAKKDAFTIRMNPELYDEMIRKLRSYRKGKSINKYVNELIAKDLREDQHEKV